MGMGSDTETSDKDSCEYCGGPIPDEYSKHDQKAPVYDESTGSVYHLGCENEVFDEIHYSIETDMRGSI